MLKVLFIVVNSSERLDEVIEALHASGVVGMTVVESAGVGRGGHSGAGPVLVGLRRLMGRNRSHNTTLIALAEDGVISRAMAAVAEVMEHFEKPGTGLLFTVTVDEVIGGAFGGEAR